MDYQEFQRYCARMGFIDAPITKEQYDHCHGCGLDDDGAYEVACDVNCGIDFDAAVHGVLIQRNMEMTERNLTA